MSSGVIGRKQTQITLPYKWKPRHYQKKLWKYLMNGGKRALCIWHRRSGKDECALHWTACAMFERVGTYWHMLPEASQARKAIWEAINPHTGKRRIDEAFPHELRETTRENEMFIRFVNGSTWQVIGSDNFDSLVGSPPVGMVASEWALSDPKSWAYLRPILAENGGWVLFVTTPRGKNHCYKMLEAVKDDPDWFTEVLTVDETMAIPRATVERELKELRAEYGDEHGLAMFRQEYYSSFEAAVIGSYYGDLMENALQEGRITRIPVVPGAPVYTAWDIGYGDSTAIWFCQMVGREPRIIDYYENSGKGLEHYVTEINKRDFNYAQHFLPHDAGHGSMRTGKSMDEQMIDMGMNKKLLTVMDRTDVEAGIAQVRTFLPQVWFDVERAKRGVDCLKAYQRKWDEKKKAFANVPLHNWASDGADAFRYLAVAMADVRPSVAKKTTTPYHLQNTSEQGWMA